MRRLLSVAMVLVVGVPASPQSLGEAARKEKERREGKKGEPTRVITDEQLKNADGKTVALPPSGASSASPSPPPGRRTSARPVDSGDSTSDEAILRQRASSLRAEMKYCQDSLARAEKDLKAAEDRAWRAGPGNSSNALDTLYRRRVEDVRRACDEIEEQARTRGIPPGYLR